MVADKSPYKTMSDYELLVQENEDLKQKIQELLEYLRLPKFDIPNNWVNVNDVFLRLKA